MNIHDIYEYSWYSSGYDPQMNFIFIAWTSEPRLICRTAQGVLLRERHSRSNTNHHGFLSNGQSCIHLSSFLLCCLIESCDLRFASQTAILVNLICDPNHSMGDQGCQWLAVFYLSGKNVLIFICLWRKSDSVSQPSSSSWVPKNLRRLPRILDVPSRNLNWILCVELYSFHGRSDADSWSESTKREEWQCRFRSTASPKAWRKSPEETRNEANTEERSFQILKILLIETRWIFSSASFLVEKLASKSGLRHITGSACLSN